MAENDSTPTILFLWSFFSVAAFKSWVWVGGGSEQFPSQFVVVVAVAAVAAFASVLVVVVSVAWIVGKERKKSYRKLNGSIAYNRIFV